MNGDYPYFGFQSRKDVAAERREAAGLPVLSCPNCGVREAHWVPESLEGPGFFTCDGGDAA